MDPLAALWTRAVYAVAGVGLAAAALTLALAGWVGHGPAARRRLASRRGHTVGAAAAFAVRAAQYGAVALVVLWVALRVWRRAV